MRTAPILLLIGVCLASGGSHAFEMGEAELKWVRYSLARDALIRKERDALLDDLQEVYPCRFFDRSTSCLGPLDIDKLYEVDQSIKLKATPLAALADHDVELDLALHGFADAGYAPSFERPIPYFPRMAYLGDDFITSDLNTSFDLAEYIEDAAALPALTVEPIAYDRLVFDEFYEGDIDDQGEESTDVDYPIYVPVQDALNGEAVLGKWNEYVEYSNTIAPSRCQDGCRLAMPVTFADVNLKGIALCTVEGEMDQAGAPEFCEFPVIFENDQAYLRSAIDALSTDGQGGGVGDETLVCVVADVADLSQALQRFKEQMLPQLNASPARSYLASGIKPKGGSLSEITITSRFSQSAFIPGMSEIGTIRVQAFAACAGEDEDQRCDGRETTVVPILTLYLANGDPRTEDAFRGPSTQEQRRVDERLLTMLAATDFACELETE